MTIGIHITASIIHWRFQPIEKYMYLSLGIIIVISEAEWGRERMLMDAAWWDKCLAAGGLLSQRILPLQWRLRIPRIPNGPFEILETKQMSIEEWNADPTSSYSFPSGPLNVLGLRYSKIYNHSTAVEINIPSITVGFWHKHIQQHSWRGCIPTWTVKTYWLCCVTNQERPYNTSCVVRPFLVGASISLANYTKKQRTWMCWSKPICRFKFVDILRF